MKPIQKQQGHAAILFVMCIPILFGVFTLASDGARALQSKARLEDAAEAAVLAVSAYGEEDVTSTQTGKDYIGHYLYDMDNLVDIKVEKLECSEIAECTADDNKRPFVEYRVAGRTQHLSWFPGNDVTIGFGESFDVTGSSKARKFQNSQPMDITFVIDFSNSMNWDWEGHGPTGSNPSIDGPMVGPSRLNELKDVVRMVTDELQIYNDTTAGPKHRVAMTGYNRRTVNKGNNKLIIRDQRITTYKPEGYDAGDIFHAQKTINKQFFTKGKASRVPNGDEEAEFFDIMYTSDFSSFNHDISEFKAGGGTASLQGIIRASQLLTYHITDDEEEANPKQLIIILSDGEDVLHYLTQMQKLVDLGMCENLINAVEGGPITADDNNADKVDFSGGYSIGLPTNTGEDPSARIAMIGFGDGYDIHDNTGLLNCVGEENAFNATDKEDILNLIMSLVSEEVGHLAQ
ncbi:pilus assembly protein TadG-related protein [Aliivibrio sp. S4TY2]|uniref:TadE/TadG family type IV pilus assembly protein n=1 Tax=unclassified Aliivibrio TaxID=2645654 RepID=UPI002377DA10|nr:MULTISPECIES: VWA domain-containing protein [unclassified Aliivibrio]MDD9157949.1 pilus assembly protein TadG-related protein [Aliivibrio sp. S4TY2]MDD9162230.1 pilus assembly protein TadG-related protein [Aliivibrio sp. S4TY1]MDD9166268.1 pilus assembly protein TadG-related protein [Aliivibrio sp. S4MY2]MDD9170259.1 pilus assembly protein TadG-related protein [Aliivibrio sp. S4MY4]MDD9187310.1 pilus assembly protein TadG-related protein [Aliivibrio sp. S4MY3]